MPRKLAVGCPANAPEKGATGGPSAALGRRYGGFALFSHRDQVSGVHCYLGWVVSVLSLHGDGGGGEGVLSGCRSEEQIPRDSS